MEFVSSNPVVDASLFPHQDWSNTEFGAGSKEEVPEDMPETRGFGFVIRAYDHSDHDSDWMTRRSRSGFLIYLNFAPVN